MESVGAGKCGLLRILHMLDFRVINADAFKRIPVAVGSDSLIALHPRVEKRFC